MDEAYACGELRFDEVADDHAQFKGYADARAYQAALTEHIHAHGIANAIGLGPAYETQRFEAGVVNRQHRYFAARDLGLTHLPSRPHRLTPIARVTGWEYPPQVSGGRLRTPRAA